MKAALALPLLLTAMPVMAEDLTPVELFVAHRAATVCVAQLGIVSIKEAVQFEQKKWIEAGLTPAQYKVFNDQSEAGGWISRMVTEKIDSRGGCKAVQDRMNRQNARPSYQL